MRFNQISVGTATTNLAGGKAYSETPELELISILLTSFVQDKYYRSATAELARLREVIKLIKDKRFVAKAALYARHEAGMRSISHAVAGEIAHLVKEERWTKTFFQRIVKRPDDMAEILGYYRTHYGKSIPHPMRKGFAKVLSSLSEYSIGKYQMKGKEISLIGLTNLLHPKATPALTKLMKGQIKATDTWEVDLSAAGQQVTEETSLESLKADAWGRLISSRKLGYFALLRNLRNIIEQAPASLPEALTMLQDRDLIKKSLILPFQFMTAVSAVGDNQRALRALNNAMEIALDNLPNFEGKTLIALDCSGSMSGRPLEIGTLFAAAMFKQFTSDVLLFSDRSGFVEIPNFDSLLTITNQLRDIARQFVGATHFQTIFKYARKYDRIIILSDMQAWGDVSTTQAFSAWKKHTGCDPKVFSLDLAGQGTLQFPQRNCYAFAGWSEKVFDVMELLEKDKSALVNTINAFSLE